jgi:hypothetical protein
MRITLSRIALSSFLYARNGDVMSVCKFSLRKSSKDFDEIWYFVVEY